MTRGPRAETQAMAPACGSGFRTQAELGTGARSWKWWLRLCPAWENARTKGDGAVIIEKFLTTAGTQSDRRQRQSGMSRSMGWKPHGRRETERTAGSKGQV